MKFRLFAAMAMATTALSIDAMLPAFAEIRHELGLPADSADTARLITAFFLGLAVGQIPMGMLADRLGRRPVVWCAGVVYLIGIGGVAMSSGLGGMVVFRFVWGLGSAGLRTVAISMIRDRFVGARMAREMSFVMAVFLTVPVIAPSIGAGIIHIMPWRMILAFTAVFGLGVMLASVAMPETLPPAQRKPLRFRLLREATGAIVRSPLSLRFTLVLTAIFGAFSSYLASSERIIGEVFHRPGQFPFLFGSVGVLMGLCSLWAGRRVEHIGLLRLIHIAMAVYAVAAVAVLVMAITTGGHPPFWLFWVALTIVLVSHNVVFPNSNSAAMIPVGHVAGTASALIGTLSTAVGSLVGSTIDGAYDGTVTPLAVGFVVSAAVAVVLAWPVRQIDAVPAARRPDGQPA